MDARVWSKGVSYLFLVIFRDLTKDITGLPEPDILLTELFLEELLRQKN